MKSMNARLLLCGLVFAIAATTANAGLVLSQNFDNTSLFDASVTTPRSIGDPNTVGGEWGTFDKVVVDGTNYGPWVVNDGSNPAAAHVGPVSSGSQSIGFETLFPGENDDQRVEVFARVNNGVPATENYELSFSLRQDDAWSSSMLTVGGNYVGADPQPIDLRVFFEGGTQNIYLLYSTGVPGQGFWIYTGIQMAEDTWMKMRVVADVNGTNSYNIFVTPEGGSEIAGEQPVPLHMTTREEIWQLDISRQGSSNFSTYFDDFKMGFPSIAVPGDFNGDGNVDGADFVAWQTHFPTVSGATLADGDANGDGAVDGADFVIWQTNFPYPPSPSASPVPEPASAGLLALAGTVLIFWRRNNWTL
ncbi:MAG: dockerin type I repeat-containing protein [Pirellulales bacterium]|nr:dockerin type I repeat-containing protein [Pirellulales bacterium]